jgi:hypothetical protein
VRDFRQKLEHVLLVEVRLTVLDPVELLGDLFNKSLAGR